MSNVMTKTNGDKLFSHILFMEILKIESSNSNSWAAECCEQVDRRPFDVFCVNDPHTAKLQQHNGAPIIVGHSAVVIGAIRKSHDSFGNMLGKNAFFYSPLCYVFPTALHQLTRQAAILINNADLQSEHKPLMCFSCNRTASIKLTLKNCAACKIAKYCSHVCQVNDWENGGHRGICKHVDVVLRIMSLPRQQHDFVFTLDKDEKDYLPAYIYNAAHKYIF
jgi:hypothetical protein